MPFLLRRQTAPLPSRPPDAVGLREDRLMIADAWVGDAVANKGVPGAVLLIARRGGVALRTVHGFAGLRPQTRPMQFDTLFDLASLTKPIATTTATMQLVESDKIGLEDPASRYLAPLALVGEDKARITVRQLLTHAGGLVAGGNFANKHLTLPEMVAVIARSRQVSPPGTRFLYSDYSAVLLQAVVEAVAGQPLDVWCRTRIWEPLGMADTDFRPKGEKAQRCAATTSGDDTPDRRGRVHDPLAASLGGISGNAGLFSTGNDLARFAQMLLQGGTYAGARILRPETVALMTTKQSPFAGQDRGLGWDLDSAYSIRGDLPKGSFGHTGYTGTSLWIDPSTQSFVILLTNGVHGGNGPHQYVISLRRHVSSAVAAAIPELNLGEPPLPSVSPLTILSAPPPATPRAVHTGLEVLTAENFRRLSGGKIGVICNHSARDRQGRHLVDLLYDSHRVNLVALFGPEHSIRGDVDASADDSRDTRTGLPVYSLYNLKLPLAQRYRPTPEQLRGIDTLVYDIQDIGARYYTYIATLGYCLEEAAKANVRVVVLDRPNPLGGNLVEGPLLDPKFAGRFTAYHTMPITHGMTVGELANLFNTERKINANIEVVKMPDWDRRLTWDEDGLPWINPSPNIRNSREMALYPGVGMLETLPISVGRGTASPFEILGAPYINGNEIASDLSGRNLPGVSFAPVRFTPDSSKFKNEECGGIRIAITDRARLLPSAMGIHLADALVRRYGQQLTPAALAAASVMVGKAEILQAVQLRASPDRIIASWADDVAAWRRRRAPFLLYPG